MFPTPSVLESVEKFSLHESNFNNVQIFIRDLAREDYLLQCILNASKSLEANTKVTILGLTRSRTVVEGNVTILPKKQISINEYSSLLLRASNVVFFYAQDNYETLTSGKFLDCVVTGRNVWFETDFTALNWLLTKFTVCKRFTLSDSKWLSSISETKLEFNMTNQVLPTADLAIDVIQQLASDGYASRVIPFKFFFSLPFLQLFFYVRYLAFLIKRKLAKKC